MKNLPVSIFLKTILLFLTVTNLVNANLILKSINSHCDNQVNQEMSKIVYFENIKLVDDDDGDDQMEARGNNNKLIINKYLPKCIRNNNLLTLHKINIKQINNYSRILMNKMETVRQYSKVLFLFDLTNVDISRGYSGLSANLLILDSIYSNCIKCHPFVVLFSVDIRILHWYAWQVIIATKQLHLKCVLSTYSSSNSALYLDASGSPRGCVPLDNGLFWIKTDFDLNKLQLFNDNQQKCNFNSTFLNVAVNHVMLTNLFGLQKVFC